jgi:hypothetical protein
MPKARLLALSRVPPLLLAAVWLAAAAVTTSCGSTRACKNNTLLVTVTLDSAAAMADKLIIAVTVGSGTPKMNTLDHTPGQASGTVEIDFPSGYPTGQKVNVGVTATHAGAPVGSGSADSTLSDGCEAVSVSVKGGAGGTGGNGGMGTGGVGAGGNDGGIGSDGAATGGKDGGVGVGGSGGSITDGGTTEAGIDGACPVGSNTMCGGCYVTLSDRNHCGSTCAVCLGSLVCNNACVAPPALSITQAPPDPAGWLDPRGAPPTVTVADPGVPGIVYECRTGPDATFTTTTPAWVNCDGASGTGRVATLAPTPSTPEGNYRTEVRYRQGTFTSAVVTARYYIHHSLDKVATCPRPGFPTDGPHFTDADYFNAATTFAAANPTLFPVTASVTFPAPAAIPARTDAIYLRNPFIKIPFVSIIESGGMYGGEGTGFAYSWPATGSNYLFNERSLRHTWVLNAARTMMLYKRHYIHPVNTVAPCQNLIWVGHIYFGTDYPSHTIDCEALVLNTKGNGLCFTTGGSAPIPVAAEAPANGVGTVSATAGAVAVVGTGTNFVGSANTAIQIPPVTGRWYKIAATPVPTATAITLTSAFVGTTGAGQAYRRTATTAAPNYAIATAFAKMHPDAHNYATGVTLPGTPSPKTKCETPGCNSGRPWLTYLPP